MPLELSDRLNFALDVASEASAFIMPLYRSSVLNVEFKRDRSPVTEADRGAEELIRRRIDAAFPNDGVLGEEMDDKPSENEFRWVLDPIDGTKSFVHGVPLFGTLIGLEYDDRVVLGVCRFPALDEVVYAAEGAGAWQQVGTEEPKPARVSNVDDLADALFCITEFEGWREIGRLDALEKLSAAARMTRGWGDCYGHALVACGRAEVIVDPLISAWDAAALIPILQEAGGHFVGWNGEPSMHAGNGVSVNAALKEAVMELLRE